MVTIDLVRAKGSRRFEFLFYTFGGESEHPFDAFVRGIPDHLRMRVVLDQIGILEFREMEVLYVDEKGVSVSCSSLRRGVLGRDAIDEGIHCNHGFLAVDQLGED
uniref:hypothetical protein n=1 Tax=Natronorubrum halophilum TaxID=1702106 RepID=UPI000EF6AF4C|nr:hypothetical protein [Natronorubrum halophilum]